MTLSGLRRGLYRGARVLGDYEGCAAGGQDWEREAAGAPAGPQGAVAGIRAGHAKGRAVMAVQLHRWVQDGQEWVCAAYDHGPFCRLCQRVDETLAACLEHVDQGFMEVVGADPDGQLRLHVTEAGSERAAELIRELSQ